MRRIFGLFLALALLCSGPAQAAELDISAASAILMDADSGRVLFARAPHEKRLIASVTKLMTALVAVESTPDLRARVKITPEDTRTEGSSIYLKAGEEITLEALLYGLLMASGNDAALAIAGYCAGDVPTFVDWMNQRAADIGMKDTHFANPSGLNDEKHYSSAADLAQLARVALEDKTLSKIVGTKTITLDGRTFSNHNKLLWRYEGCTGMKTGYTDKAGRTLVSSAKRAGQQLIVVTLNDPNDWRDHAALFDYGFSTYPAHLLARGGKVFSAVPVTGSLSRFVPVCTKSNVYYPLAARERVWAKIMLPPTVTAPVTAGGIAGQLTFYLDDVPIGETYLCYAQSVADDSMKRHSLFPKIWDLFCSKSPALAFLYREAI